MYMELIENYSLGGDVFLVVLGLLFLLILKETYVKREKRSYLFTVSLILVTVAAAANIMFYYAVKNTYGVFWIYFFRDIYHCTFLMIFMLYIEYLVLLVEPARNQSVPLKLVSLILNVTAMILDCLAPITHLGFYLNDDNVWINDNLIKPFTYAYLANVIMIVAVLFVFHKRLIPKVRKILYITETVCIAIVITEDIIGHNSYLTLTFALPIIVVVFMLHSNSYDLETGALNLKSMENYLVDRQARGGRDVYMCLKLNMEKRYAIPGEMGKAFYGFYTHKFKKALLFNPYPGFMVLAIKDEKNEDIMSKAEALIHGEFKTMHAQFNVDYKIVVLEKPIVADINEFMRFYEYYANRSALNTYKMVYEEDFEQFRRSQTILKELQDINLKCDLEDERVLLYCQPVKNVHTGIFDTAEALMRLQVAELGMVMPGEFIPIAEENDCIHTLSMIILNKTCQLVSNLLDEGFDWNRISVNFSMTELSIPSFIEDFERIVSQHEVPFGRIGVELTESRNDTDYNTVTRIVTEMRRLGSYLYLDDFGTGYSNLERLLVLNFNVVKFDRSLLLLTDNDEQRVMLQSLAMAFHQLGYELLYEGVENDHQESLCLSNSASYLQGFKYSKPIPAQDLDQFLVQHGSQRRILIAEE